MRRRLRLLESFTDTAEVLEPVEILNEDDLWEKLNATYRHVHTEIKFRDGEYVCEVFFHNRNGSSIFAKAKDRDRLHSMTKCLEEIDKLM